MDTLSGKSALVTGVSNPLGIGLGIARHLAAQGADVFAHGYAPYDGIDGLDRSYTDPDAIVADLRTHGTRIVYQAADFAQPEAPAWLVEQAVETFGVLDVLVINHTYDTMKGLDELTAEEIDRHLHINIRAALLLVQAFARAHDGRAGGRIVMLTSGQHLGPMPDVAYVASKGALHQLTASLSDHLIGRGITVNTVNPGPTRTYEPGPELDAAVIARMPQGRWGFPEDAARLIGWLASDEAAWVTGQVINSEGGFRRG